MILLIIIIIIEPRCPSRALKKLIVINLSALIKHTFQNGVDAV